MVGLFVRESASVSRQMSSGRARRLAVKGSVSLLAVACASAANAQCAPDPLTPPTETVCTGTDPNGITITVPGGTVVVNKDATVNGILQSIELPPMTFFALPTTLIVDGGVTGGISINPLVNTTNSVTQRVILRVGEAATVTGPAAIRLAADPTRMAAGAILTLDNAGVLSATGPGPAIRSANPAFAYFDVLSNVGTIGGIDAVAETLVNEGTIDGGGVSAVRYDLTSVGFPVANVSSFSNNGLITSASAAATVSIENSVFNGPFIQNLGTIRNFGTGAAIAGLNSNRPQSIDNVEGGTIEAVGNVAINGGSGGLSITNRGTISGKGDAITTDGAVIFVNTGTINGSIVATGVSEFGASMLNLASGQVNGGITLGAGNDMVTAVYDPATRRIVNVTGPVSAGGGTNSFTGVVLDNAIATGPLSVDGFQNFRLSLNGVTLTLDKGYTQTETLTVINQVPESPVAAKSSIVNLADFSVAATVVRIDQQGVSFENRGNIATTAAEPFTAAVQVRSLTGDVINSGTITSVMDGVLAFGGVQNSGTIFADGVGVTVERAFNNTGTIQSKGLGALFFGSDVQRTNSGTIEGDVYGLRMSTGSLTNTGTIRSTSGSAVQITSATLFNDVGGRVTTSDGLAIEGFFPAASARIVNAGIIEGSIDLGSGDPTFFFPTRNRVVLLPGSEVRGDIRLGDGNDELVVPFEAVTAAGIAGVTGTVSSNGSAGIRYLVSKDTATTVQPPIGFSAVGYQLLDNAKLSLSGGTGGILVSISGVGKADLSLDMITTTTRTDPLLDLATPSAPLNAGPAIVNNLDVISRGRLSRQGELGLEFSGNVVTVGVGTKFENAGTIVLFNRPSFDGASVPGTSAGIRNFGGTVTNSGTIEFGGLRSAGIEEDSSQFGTSLPGKIINTGVIRSFFGATAAVGVSGVRDLDNRGVILTAGVAVTAGGGFGQTSLITNSGRIESIDGIAITSQQFSNPARVVNTGTIIGGFNQAAISLNGGVVDNAGSITGDVNVFDGAYVARGGTLSGNLTLGNSGKLIVFQEGQIATGQVLADGFNNQFLRVFSATTTTDVNVAPQTGFESTGLGVAGTDTVLTTTGTFTGTSRPTLFGHGRIVNRADLTQSGATGFGSNVIGDAQLNRQAGLEGQLDFVNEGKLRNVAAVTRSFSNSGTITGSESFNGALSLDYGSGTTFDFANSGRIEAKPGAAGFPAVAIAGNKTSEDALRASFKNSGEIFGGTNLNLQARELTFANAGVMTGLRRETGNAAGVGINVRPIAGSKTPTTLKLENSGQIADSLLLSTQATTFDIKNSGSITLDPAATDVINRRAALAIANRSLGDQQGTLVNSGTVKSTATGSSAISGFFGNASPADSAEIPFNAASVTIRNTGTVLATGGADYDAGTNRVKLGSAIQVMSGSKTNLSADIVNAAGGRIEASGAFVGDTGIVLPGDAGLSAIVTRTGKLFIDNSGVIAGGRGTDLTQFPEGAIATGTDQLPLLADGKTFLAGAIHTTGSADIVFNRLGGEIIGSVDLGEQDDVFENFGTVRGNVLMGDGNDRVSVGALATLVGTVDGGAGVNSLVISTTGASGQRFSLDPYLNFGQVSLNGTGSIGLAGKLAVDSLALFGTSLTVAEGDTLATAGPIAIIGTAGLETVVNKGTIAGGISLDGNNDVLTNFGTITGTVELGADADTLTNFANGVLATVDTGGGNDVVTNTGTIASIALQNGDDKLTNAVGGKLTAVSFGNGANSLTNQGQIAGPLSFGSGADTVINSGTIAGAIAMGDGNDSFTNSGDLSGATLDFGGGADVFTAQKGGRFGNVSGGAGEDTLALQLGGTDAQPSQFIALPPGFEVLRNDSGTVLIAAPASFERLEVVGGRVIGGTRLTAPSIIVNQGATFGSAGQVIGNIQVAGTLSPGASPGVMQVTGNVALAGTSTTVFELTPTVSDQLLISGTLSIAQGSTLQITPESTIRPGGQLDLIVANGGITGAFSTISTGGALGFIRALPDRIQLLGQFANTGFNRQTTNTIDFVNRVLVSGRAPAGLLTALPNLLGPNGATNGAAFARLSAESYASAGQIGTEQGLALATAARNMPLTSSDTAGLFGFAGGILNERFLSGSARLGTTSADVRSRGLFGGIGYGTAELAVGAFVGTIGSDQDLAGLGASNDTDGFVAGVTGQYAGGPLGIRFTFAYDDSDATTQRAVPGASLRGMFGLRSWIGDGSVSYALPISSEFQLVPEAGLTWVSTRRGRVTEAGSPFALGVSRLTREMAFADGSIALRTVPEAGSIQSWLKAGIRQQLTGDRTFAVAGFQGVDLRFVSRGVTRSRTLGVLGAGLSADLGRNLRVFANYQGEFGSSGEGHNASLGLRLGF